MKTLLYLCLTLTITCRLNAQPPIGQQSALPTTAQMQNPMIRHLPPDACSIYQFNLPVLRTKLPLQQLTERIPLPQKNTYNRELAAILREPGRAGVDTNRDIFLTETNAPGRDSLHSTSLLVHLADSALWGAFLRRQEPGSTSGAAWDNQLAVITFVRSRSRTIPPAVAATRQSQALLKGFDDSTGIHDPLFVTGFSDDADIHAWTNQGTILFLLLQQLFHLDHTPAYPALTAPGCPKMRTLSALWFEKGRVRLKNTLCLPPGTDSLYARLTTRPLSDDLLSRVPPGKLLAMFNLHFDPAAIAGLLDGLQARGRSEALLFDKGVSLETFARGFQGDFMLTALQPPTPPRVADSIAPQPPTRPASQTPPPRPTLFLAAALHDLPAFWSWTSHLKWLNPTADPSGAGRVSTRNPISKQLPAYRIKDSLLVIGSNQKRLAAWFDDSARISDPASDTITISSSAHFGTAIPAYPPRNDPARSTRTAALRRFRESPLSGWIDLKAVAAALQQRPPAEKNRASLSLLSTLDLLTLTAGHLNSKGQLENTTELTLLNREENSLKTLFRLLQ